jgi:hypothetical protein
MAQYQITWWNSLPSLVVARGGEEQVKVSLASRLQEAIDEAAMRMGAIDADAYMNGWKKSEWLDADGAPVDVAERMAKELEEKFGETEVAAYLESLVQG